MSAAGTVRADAGLLLDLAIHASQEAIAAIVRVADTATTGTEITVLATALALLEARSQALRRADLCPFPPEVVAALGNRQGATLNDMLASAGLSAERSPAAAQV